MNLPVPPEPTILLERLLRRLEGSGPGPTPTTQRIPADVYTDSARFARERDRLFRGRPLVIGHRSQLAGPGDALVYDWLGLPLITLRDGGGNIATFINACRHRGVRLLEAEGSCSVRSLVCPYHQWTYGTDGALRNIPRGEAFAGLDPAALGLVPVPTEVRHGLIWVQASPGEAMDLDGHLAGLGRDLDYFGIPGSRYFTRSLRTVDCNWKLIQDAFLDGYHIVRLHRNTVGSFFPDALAESDSIGDHIRNGIARREIEEARALPCEQWDLRHHTSFSYTVFPNTVIVLHPDYTSILGLFPESPHRTTFVHTMLTPHEPATDKERDHYQRSFELIDKGVFEAEDIRVCVAAQRSLRSGATRELLFGGLEEAAVRFHRIVDRHLAAG